jgi:beta-N-acetylhexosaminidase
VGDVVTSELSRLAHGLLFPALGRPTPPVWVASRVERGLAGFVVFGRDIVSGDQLHTLTGQLHGMREHLLLATDEEGGDVTRIEYHGGTSVPGNYALGRLDDLAATRAAAQQIGLSLVDAGIDWDLAPAVDTAVNPLSPNGVRTFGADRDRVAEHAAAWVEGLQSTGVSGCAKHYPGHGLSGADAHLATPTVDVSRDELLGWYLDPFRSAIAAGVDSIMVSHDLVPRVDDVPATLSRVLITDVLRGELGYDGVVITDALEMRGVRDVAPLAEAAVRAVAAGADALCLGSASYREDVDTAADALVSAVQRGDLGVARLVEANNRVARLGRRTRAPRALRDDDVGRRLADRAVRVTGDPRLRGPHVLVVRLEPDHSPAAGRPGADLEGELVARGLSVERLAVGPGTYNGAATAHAEVVQFTEEFGDDGDVVLLVRSPHRFPWQQTVITDVLGRHPRTVVVDMGFEGLDLSAARGWVQTFGAAGVCTRAAVAALTDSR